MVTSGIQIYYDIPFVMYCNALNHYAVPLESAYCWGSVVYQLKKEQKTAGQGTLYDFFLCFGFYI